MVKVFMKAPLRSGRRPPGARISGACPRVVIPEAIHEVNKSDEGSALEALARGRARRLTTQPSFRQGLADVQGAHDAREPSLHADGQPMDAHLPHELREALHG